LPLRRAQGDLLGLDPPEALGVFGNGPVLPIFQVIFQVGLRRVESASRIPAKEQLQFLKKIKIL